MTRVYGKVRELISGRIGEVPNNVTIFYVFFFQIYLVMLFDISRNEVA